HNRYVVKDLRDRGAVFVDQLDEVPDEGTVIFSAHGVPQSVRTEAERRGLKVFDATCPLVTKVHLEVTRFSQQGRECVLIGHTGHPEVEGTMGQYDESAGGSMYLVEDLDDVKHLVVRNPDHLGFVTQTTLSVDDSKKVVSALKARFPNIKGPHKDDICYATQNRQDAVRQLAQKAGVVLVLGSPNSSNSNRLRELAEQQGVSSHLLDGPEQIQKSWLEGKEWIGVTAGASAPEILVQQVIERLRGWGAAGVEEQAGCEETITFALPRKLRVTSSPGE
ncbi:MAG TPA: 4-hydroxy-3-methylbut-2-enyl diphosphate reductase, partial [Gammaproteobacteria bacterium]|nr:4-hydroxy-3-methylbut-2-enyl diphosphate reductase [Gammaproteobacteria bacterium]